MGGDCFIIAVSSSQKVKCDEENSEKWVGPQ